MLYRDLVQYDPIESIIRLRETEQRDTARDLVRTYVISDRMADRLADLVIPQLDLDRPRDNRGVLIVGNYGTGKSHLMSVLAGVAEFPELAADITHHKVAEASGAIAGRFKVLRVELGAVQRSLRDILFDEVEQALDEWGTPYHFPSATEVNNNKDPLIEAIGIFQTKYPGQGILLVVDELLDYLRTREERELILDLGFLRELGEVTSATRFRFIGGLQEMLFENPRFAFVASQLRRVRDRFEQIMIDREDIAYVVSHRLLKKDDRQLAWIRDHLRQFEPFYEGLSERMDEFATLFPIHPSYIDTFQEVFIAEKREVLTTFSKAIGERIDDVVPSDRPGLISFDHYWDVVRRDPSLRSVPEVAEVADKSKVLENKVRQNYTRKALLPMAIRIIHALSVHRLTTNDIDAPVGLTPEALCNGLFLYENVPERSADFLLSQVRAALREIMHTVQGQFISCNEVNGQYYVDVKKDIDFDAQIEARAEMLGSDVLNRYYKDALRQALNLSDSTYVTNYQIWFYELPWPSHRVTRPGYIFFGYPNERSTAQPPRDFYVYILPPFGKGEWQDEERDDEVILAIRGAGDDFSRLVRLYAGARDLEAVSAQNRQVYADKAATYLRQLVTWLRENLAQHLEVTFQGVTRPVREVLAETRSSATDTVRELIDLVSAQALEPTFDEMYPDYPAFTRATVNITEEARENTATLAIRAIAGLRRTTLAEAVLDGLGLLDAQGQIRPGDSPYAQHYLRLLADKGEGQVVNRSEVIEIVAGDVDRPIEKDPAFFLEPDWIAVVLAALAYRGLIEISYGAQRVGASNIADLATMSPREVADFRHYGRPPDVPVGRWVQIFEALGLSPGLITDENSREQAVKDLQSTVAAELERVVEMEHRVTRGQRLWNMSLFTDGLSIQSRDGLMVDSDRPDVTLDQIDLLPQLRAYKRLLERLQPYTSVGKLRNLRVQPQEVTEGARGREVVRRLSALLRLMEDLRQPTDYLANAVLNLPAKDPLREGMSALREDLMDALRKMGRGDKPVQPGQWAARLAEMKRRYIQVYAREHRRLRLGPAADHRREAIYRGKPLRFVLELDKLRLLPSHDLATWKGRLTDLQTCPGFHEGVLEDEPVCPHCLLNPAAEQATGNAEEVLATLEDQLDEMVSHWRGAVVEALQSEVAQQSLAAMTPDERQAVETFLEHPEAMTLPDGFVEAANKALRGIEAVDLNMGEMVAALREGGLPCTVGDFRSRFNGFLQRALRGHDEENARITLSEAHTA